MQFSNNAAPEWRKISFKFGNWLFLCKLVPFCQVDSREDMPFVGIQRRKMIGQDVDDRVFAVPMQCCEIVSHKRVNLIDWHHSIGFNLTTYLYVIWMVLCPSWPANCFDIIVQLIAPGGWLPYFSPYTMPQTGHSMYKLIDLDLSSCCFCCWSLWLMIKWFKQFKCIRCSQRINDTAGLFGSCCNSSRHIAHGRQFGHFGGWTTDTKRLILSLSASTPTIDPFNVGRKTSSSSVPSLFLYVDSWLPYCSNSLLSWLKYVEIVSTLGRLPPTPTDDVVIL